MKKKLIISGFVAVMCAGAYSLSMNKDHGGGKTLVYKTLDEEKFQRFSQKLNVLLKNYVNEKSLETVSAPDIRYESNLESQLESLFNWLKGEKVLFRHNIVRAFEPLRVKYIQVNADNVDDVNSKFKAVTDRLIQDVPLLRFEPALKKELVGRLRELGNPFKAKSVLKTNQIIKTNPLKEGEKTEVINALNSITKLK